MADGGYGGMAERVHAQIVERKARLKSDLAFARYDGLARQRTELDELVRIYAILNRLRFVTNTSGFLTRPIGRFGKGEDAARVVAHAEGTLRAVCEGGVAPKRYVISEDGMHLGEITNDAGAGCHCPGCHGHGVSIHWDTVRHSRPCSTRLVETGECLYRLVPHPRHETDGKE